ncbi:hypothetical protein LXA43DRAFT_682734 [Ganoderma leucocontextum]|nr:hypothetical protein LXA43DRAFT_682734 [Ganoderma leucocontextum]
MRQDTRFKKHMQKACDKIQRHRRSSRLCRHDVPGPSASPPSTLRTHAMLYLLTPSGDECLKFISCLTEWALPENRLTGRTDTNFDHRSPPPELEAQSAAGPTPTESAITRYVAPFNVAFNTQFGYFPWPELPENEGRFVRFGHAMTGTRQWEIKNQILRGFSWEDLPKGSVLIDVGGGIGAQSPKLTRTSTLSWKTGSRSSLPPSPYVPRLLSPLLRRYPAPSNVHIRVGAAIRTPLRIRTHVVAHTRPLRGVACAHAPRSRSRRCARRVPLASGPRTKAPTAPRRRSRSSPRIRPCFRTSASRTFTGI